MKVIIIGGNLSGFTAAKRLADNKNMKMEIDVFNEENAHFYSRPRLEEYFTDEIPLSKLIPYTEEYFAKKGINYHINTKITTIDIKEKSITASDGKNYKYDKLLFATGAKPFIPPIENSQLTNIFTYRTLADVEKIKGVFTNLKQIAIIGGGLLGIETAKVFGSYGKEIIIIERMKWPMGRQLDEEMAKFFTEKIKPFNFTVHCGIESFSFVGEKGHVIGIKLPSATIPIDAVIISTGIISNTDLAKNTNVVKVNRGIVVNEFMETSIPDIYAAGDCAEFKGIVWGNIPIALAQAKVAADNIIKTQSSKFEDLIPELQLSISEVSLSVVGDSNPSDKDKDVKRYYFTVDKTGKVCLCIKNSLICGAAAISTTKGWNIIKKLSMEKRQLPFLAELLEKQPEYEEMLKALLKVTEK